MINEEKLKSLYFDLPTWSDPVRIDDFLIAIGKTQSNSVYHVAEVRKRPHPKHRRMYRYHMKVYKSDLLTALRRDEFQVLWPFQWYERKKKTA